MNEISKYISLKQYIPIGTPKISNFELKSEEIKIENTDQVMVLNEFISVDPYMRARMTEKKNYKEPFKIGKAMDGLAIGKVIQTNSNNFNVGDIVSSNFGWRDKYVTSEKNIKKIIHQDIPLSAYLGPLGMTGYTAYIGLFKIGEIKENQTILVSSAGGSVGSTVCQIAKMMNCKVVASTGSDKKVDWLKNELNVDHAFNYKKIDNLVLYLKEVCPEGFDMYFDNVGGEFLESAIFRMKNFGKIIICGRISQMSATSAGSGLKNMAHVLVKRLTIRGFLIFDHENDSDNFQQDMTKWIQEGKIKFKETIYDGIDNAPQAFVDLLNGKNIGKMLVKI
tara:strand:- start:8445 stop:9452 length:1008 start_codon:yes stop_codon:yes gene_type:complete